MYLKLSSVYLWRRQTIQRILDQLFNRIRSKWKKTTEWLNWFRNNQPKRIGKFAELFHVSGDAKIFSVDSHLDHEYLKNNFPHPQSNKLTDWVSISSLYDAVHCTKYLLPDWDCESTLWLNTEKLKPIKTLKIQEGAIETDNSVDVNNGNLSSRPTEQGGAVKVESRNPDSGASGVTAQTLHEDFDGISLLPSKESKQSKPTISPVKNEQLPSGGGMARFFRILFHAALASFYSYLNSYH
ncbi:hypothetical protein [Endozoicomonas sp.]|uniref:hypothetical protein n=1 Tax=Endozoicomonas sp. TaxID=1892382 RepID=UPI00383A576E